MAYDEVGAPPPPGSLGDEACVMCVIAAVANRRPPTPSV